MGDQKYLIGVDGGTQSTKVIIVDLEGHVVSEGRRQLRPMHRPIEGAAEHPDDDLWDSLVSAFRAAVAGFPGDIRDIVGIGLGSIRSCRAFLRADGSLAYPVISWLDRRAYGPFPRPAEDIRYVTTTTGYLGHRLTGRFADTIGNYAAWQWPSDMEAWTWSRDDARFEAMNVPRDEVMELQMPGTVLGGLTVDAAEALGLAAGTPVVATANDKAVEALGTGLMQSTGGLVSLGTYTTSMVNGEKWIANPESFRVNFAAIPHRYLYENHGIARGMWTVSWFRNLFGPGLEEEAKALGTTGLTLLNNEAARVGVGSDGLATIPEWQPVASSPRYRKGAMIGFDARHGRGHMFRSLMEGIALTLFNNLSHMSEESGTVPSRMIVSGGGAKGETFVQIIADVFGVPVDRNEVEDAAGMGAAICAAVGVGVYQDFDSAATAMIRVADVHEPDATNHARYAEINEEYFRRIRPVTDPLLEGAYPLFNR